MRVLAALNLCLLVAWVGLAIAVWPDLSEPIPVHFGLDGEPNRWAERSLFSWFVLPGCAVLMTLFLHGVGWIIPRCPELINMKGKEQLLSLPTSEQARVLVPLQRAMGGVALVTTVLLLSIHVMSWRVLRGESGALFMYLGFAVFFLGLVPIVIKSQKDCRRLIRESASKQSSDG